MANSTINGLTATTALATNDQFVVWSASANGTRKVSGQTLDNLLFRPRTAETDPTGKTFPVLTYSSSGVPTIEALTFANLVLGIDINTANLVDGSVTSEKIAASIRENAWVEKTTAYAAVAKDRIFADTTSGSFIITLPTSPAVFDWIILTDIAKKWPTNKLTVARGITSHKIDGLAESLVCDVSAEIILRYEGATQGWRVFAYGY
jgi:hypothetical protein